MNVTLTDFLPASCEMAMIFGLLFMLLAGILKLEKSTNILDFIAPLTLAICFSVLLLLPHSNVHAFSGTFVGDYYAYSGKFSILILSFFTSIITARVRRYENIKSFEFSLLLMFSILGMLVMISAIDFIVAFISLEILSLSSYVLVSMNKNSPKASEAGMKYFIYGSIATAFFLFGISFLYGFTGSTHFDNIATDLHTAVAHKKDMTIAFIGVVFILLAFCIKLAMAPVHFWLADVFQGTTLSAIAIIATAPKVAEVMLLMRILLQCLPDLIVFWKPILYLITILSLTMGTFAALTQNNVRRFLAFSATANMGFVFLGLAQGTEIGCASAGFYIFLYALTNLGVFGLLMFLETKGIIIEQFQDLSAIVDRYPLSAFCFGFLIISIAGIPFAPGFFAKIFVLYAAMFQEAYTLSTLAILSSVISIGYYLRFLKSLSMLSPTILIKKIPQATSVTLKISLTLLFAFVLGTLGLLNFFVYISHKTAIAMIH